MSEPKFTPGPWKWRWRPDDKDAPGAVSNGPEAMREHCRMHVPPQPTDADLCLSQAAKVIRALPASAPKECTWYIRASLGPSRLVKEYVSGCNGIAHSEYDTYCPHCGGKIKWAHDEAQGG